VTAALLIALLGACALLVLGGVVRLLVPRATHQPRHALGAADDLTGWPEELAAINAAHRADRARRTAPTERFSPAPVWIAPEDVPPAMVRPYYLSTQEVPDA